MAKRRLITVYDFQQWHPEKLICDTDAAYTKLANAIFGEIEEYLSFMEPNERPGVAIALAQYIEDMISETHQMEVFMKFYKEMFHYDLPFYDDDPEKLEYNKMQFVIWHAICSQRNGRFVNPITSVDKFAELLLPYIELARTKFGCTPNEDLAGYIYSEETLEDPMHVKNVLMWIEGRSFLGRWQNNRPNDDDSELKEYFPEMDKGLIAYGNASIHAFSNQAWPLSLQAKSIYAEMIRMDVDDPEDEMAQDVENIKFHEIGIFHALELKRDCIIVENFRGEKLMLDPFSGDRDLVAVAKKEPYTMGALFEYRGKWNVCGVNLWVDFEEYKFKEYCKEQQAKYSYFHDFEHQYDDYIKAHGGRRVFFFKDNKEYAAWLKKDLGVKGPIPSFPEEWNDTTGYAVFFEYNGQSTISYAGQLLCHPDNPYYDEAMAEEAQFYLIGQRGDVSPGLLMYAMAHNMLSVAAMNDRRGAVYGWQTLQNNMEFLARCLRRDIKSNRVVCPRKELSTSDNPNSMKEGLMTYEMFIKELDTYPKVKSRQNKLWKIDEIDIDQIVMHDEKGKYVFLDTRDVYKAYRDLFGTKKFTTADVSRYVPKADASAATAILYSLIDNGRLYRIMGRMFNF